MTERKHIRKFENLLPDFRNDQYAVRSSRSSSRSPC